MTAPQYITRGLNTEDRYEAPSFRAIRFVEGMPSSHWHVNFGHPRIELLKDLYWVQTKTGPVEIFDGQWVVLHPTNGLYVMSDEDFNKAFEPLSDYE